MTKSKYWSAAIAIAVIVCLVWIARALYGSLLPLFIGFGFAYAFSPVVDYLEQNKVPRALGVTLLMAVLILTIILLLAAIIPALLRDAADFFSNFPNYLSTALTKAAELASQYGIELPLQKEMIANVEMYAKNLSLETLAPVMTIARNVFTGVGAAIVSVLSFLIVPVFFFFFLRDLPKIRRATFNLIPKRYQAFARKKFYEVDQVLSGYIRGQMMVAIILSVIFSLGLSIIGVKYGFFIGMMAGLLNMIPYLGQALGLVLSLIMALVDFHGWGTLFAVPILFGIANFIEGTFITPKVVGNKVGLSPVQTIIALIIGGDIGGFIGLLIAIPVAGVLKVFITDAIEVYKSSDFYKG